jgi:thiamine biosynthesis lipoprotein
MKSMAFTHRREFLYAACGGGLAGLAIFRQLLRGGDDLAGSIASPDSTPQQFTVRKSAMALGAEVSITALHTDQRRGNAAVDAAFAELELVERLMSIYRPESQLSRLNRDKVLVDPHPYLVEVLTAARAMSERSCGAFDATVQPLWELYQTAKSRGCLPVTSEIEAARQQIDWHRVEITPRRITLQGQGTAVTLNGIAQGFAADRVVATLRSHGVEHALVDTGEMSALGVRQDGDAWTVGLQHPRHEDAYISLAQLSGRCLATSGDYATTFSPDFKHHHIFNPRTGASPEALASVSVLAPTAIQADALSTALFVMGPEDGIRLVRETPGTDAFLVFKNGRTFKTPGFTTTSATEEPA